MIFTANKSSAMSVNIAALCFAAAIVAVTAEESTTTATAAAVVPNQNHHKDQTAASSDLDNEYMDLGSISSGLMSPNTWKPIAPPASQHAHDSGAEPDIKTITITKQVPVPYPVTVEKRVPVRVEVPVDKPYPVYVPRPYHVYVEKTVPYHVGVAVPQPYTVERHVPVPVRVPVDKPVPVPVAHHYPVFMYKKVPYTVERQVPYPVKVPYFRPYPVHIPIEKHVPVPVEKAVPYPVHVPVERPVPVPVEKPVPYPVEKLVAVPVEKLVPVPFKVPVKVHVNVPVPMPVVSHYPRHEASGSHQQYTATEHSHPQPNHHTYQVDETREEASDTPRGEYSEVYAQSGQNQWAQLGPITQHQSDPNNYDGHVRFPQGDHEVDTRTNFALLNQDSTFRHVGTNIKVGQGEADQGPNDLTLDNHSKHYYDAHNQGGSSINQMYSQEPQHHPHGSHDTTKFHHPPTDHREDGANEAAAGSQNDIADFEKRLKNGRQESYSKVSMGPAAYANAVAHGQAL